jgi:hypothetical protein
MSLTNAAIVKINCDVLRAVDDVMISKNVTVSAGDYARTQRAEATPAVAVDPGRQNPRKKGSLRKGNCCGLRTRLSRES